MDIKGSNDVVPRRNNQFIFDEVFLLILIVKVFNPWETRKIFNSSLFLVTFMYKNLNLWRAYRNRMFYPPVSKASSKVTNLTERKIHTPYYTYCHKTGTRPPSCVTPRQSTIYGVNEFVCLSFCLSVCYKLISRLAEIF